MKLWHKILIGTGVGGAVAGGIWFLPKLIRLNASSAKLDSIPSAKIHKFSPLTGLTIRIDVKLKNPTPVAFKLKYPYVRLTQGEDLLGTSESVNQDIGMPGFGEVNIERIMFNIPMLKLLSLAGSLLKSVQSGQQVQVDIITMTYIDPYWNYDEEKKTWKRMSGFGKKTLLPYSEKKPVTLAKQKAE